MTLLFSWRPLSGTLGNLTASAVTPRFSFPFFHHEHRLPTGHLTLLGTLTQVPQVLSSTQVGQCSTEQQFPTEFVDRHQLGKFYQNSDFSLHPYIFGCEPGHLHF